jgi:Domain of unknown function (DUF4260)
MSASLSRLNAESVAPPAQDGGAVSGSVRAILRLEGAAMALTAAALYGGEGFSWLLFAFAFLAPDLSMLAYLWNPRAGAFAYNLLHITAFPLGLALAGAFIAKPILVALGLIWIAHIGLDRALGFGLKYTSGFGETHLGRIGRR